MTEKKKSIIDSLKTLLINRPYSSSPNLRLSQKIRELSKIQIKDVYKRDFLIPIQNDNQDFTNPKIKQEILLKKLCNEKIPKKDIIKRAIEKDSDQFPKEENKEKFFQNVFQNIYNTLSPEGREQIKIKKPHFTEDIQNEFNVQHPKIRNPLDNNIISDLCHNFISVDDLLQINTNPFNN